MLTREGSSFSLKEKKKIQQINKTKGKKKKRKAKQNLVKLENFVYGVFYSLIAV